MDNSKKINITNLGGISAKNLVTSGLVYNEGRFYLFLVACGGKMFFTSSQDGFTWRTPKLLLKSHNLFTKYGDGSAIIRGGKLYVAYTKKVCAINKTCLAISRDFTNFNTYPIPIINKNTATKNSFKIIQPRLIYSDNSFYMMCAKKHEVAILGSQNLMNWQHIFNIDNNFDSHCQVFNPSLVTLFGCHIFIFSYMDKRTKKLVSAYNTCDISLNEKTFKKTSPLITLPSIVAPKTSVLPDGRVILLSTLPLCGNNYVLSTPKELYYDNGLIQKPLQELLRFRTEKTSIPTTDPAQGIVISDFSAIELDCDIALNSDNKLNITFVNSDTNASLVATLCGDTKTATLNGETVKLSGATTVKIKLLVFPNRVELFFDGGLGALAQATTANFCKKLIISATLSTKCAVSYYNLKID